MVEGEKERWWWFRPFSSEAGFTNVEKNVPKLRFRFFLKNNYRKKLKVSLSKSNVEFRFFSFPHPCFLDLITSASFVRTFLSSWSLFECERESGGTKKRERKILHRVKDAKIKTQAIFPAKKQQKTQRTFVCHRRPFLGRILSAQVLCIWAGIYPIYFFLEGGVRWWAGKNPFNLHRFISLRSWDGSISGLISDNALPRAATIKAASPRGKELLKRHF